MIPRSVAFRYKGLQADPATVGLALNARTILTGRIVRHGDVLNIQAELVDTSTESQLWGEQFRPKSADLIVVQEEIAWQISESLRLKLTGEQKKKLRRRATVNPDAYQDTCAAAITGTTFHRTVSGARAITSSGQSSSIRHTRLLTPDSATHSARWRTTALVPPGEGFPRAGAAARRAVELDPDLADSHVTLGIERLFWGWDWPAAERELQMAIRLNPKLALAHSVYGLVLGTCGRHEEAKEHVLHARELDPLSLFINAGVSWMHHFAGRPADAAREALKTREIVPGFEEAGNVLISSYETLGEYEKAAELITQQRCWGVAFDGRALAEAFRSGGATGYWRKRLELMESVATAAPAPMINFAFAIVLHNVGRFDDALDHVERMVDLHIGGCVFLGVDPGLRALHGQPRFEAVLKRIGVPLRQKASAAHTTST